VDAYTRWFLLLAGCALALGCGGEPFAAAGSVDAGPSDGATPVGEAGNEGGAPPPSSVYPASHPSLPIVTNLGGPILDSPEIILVTFAGDPLASQLSAFADAVGTTHWWDTVRQGYCAKSGTPCLGPAKHVSSVVLPAFDPVVEASGLDDNASDTSSMKQFIRAQITAGLLPPPTSESVYMIFFPDGLSIRTFDAYLSCDDWAGYHSSTPLVPRVIDPPDGGDDAGPDPEFAYIVLPRCQETLDQLTRAASHELIESATDPNVDENAYFLTDTIWAAIFGGNEIADLCVDVFTQQDTIVESGLTLQRVWSNDAVAIGADPCVPATTTAPYFNTAPPSDVLRIVPQVPTTIELDGFSQAPTSDWQIDPTDLFEVEGQGQYFDLRLDSPSANNGTKRELTVTLLRPAPPGSPIGAPLVLQSTAGGQTHFWPVAVIAVQ
jgi:hypothetical protein